MSEIERPMPKRANTRVLSNTVGILHRRNIKTMESVVNQSAFASNPRMKKGVEMPGIGGMLCAVVLASTGCVSAEADLDNANVLFPPALEAGDVVDFGAVNISAFAGDPETGEPADTLFIASFTQGGTWSCTEEQVSAACYYHTCPTDLEETGAPASAGTISLEIGDQHFDISPDESQFYFFPLSQTEDITAPFWGKRVTVRAAGDPSGVPAFDFAVRLPAPITLVSPDFPPRDFENPNSPRLPIDRGEDLELTWGGAAVEQKVNGRVDVTVHGVGSSQDFVHCEFSAQNGHGTIPTDVLALLPAGDTDMIVVSEDVRSRYKDGWWITGNAGRAFLFGQEAGLITLQ